MANVFKEASSRFEKSTLWYLFGLALFGYGLYLGIQLFIEDYQTNIAVASMIPTRKVFEDTTIIAMARVIQLAPIIFGYAFLRDAKWSNRLNAFIALAFLLMDWLIGVIFRSDAFRLDAKWIWYSAAEDFVFFTAGSEMLIMFSVGMLWNMVGDGAKRIMGAYDSKSNRPPAKRPIQPSKPLPHYNKDAPKSAKFIDVQSLLRTNSERTNNERTMFGDDPNKKEKIIATAKHWKKQHGSYPSTAKLAEMFDTSRGYVSDVMNAEFSDYGSGG